MKKVAILGPGLIGGSLALALMEKNPPGQLTLWDRDTSAFNAIKKKLPNAELTTDPVAAVREAELVLLCTPIETMVPLMRKVVHVLTPDTLVTDVGSVKADLVREMEPLLADRALWIGGHPMAGSEQGGFAAARADLFTDSTVILTPTERTPPKALTRARAFWKKLDAKIISFDPSWHDLAIAQVSHLPHLIAAGLVSNVVEQALPAAGPGLRDSTRIASGPPKLWTEILWANREALLLTLHPFLEELEKLQEALQNEDKSFIRAFLQDAHDQRKKLVK